MAESQTNKAWGEIFNSLNLDDALDEDSLAYISAKEIKEYGKREPRLMCKFDDRESRPRILKDRSVTILPIKNGEYALIKGDGYQALPPLSHHINFIEWPVEKKLETLPTEPRSESQVIDIAFASGLLSGFLDDDNLILTIRGRLRANPFEFYFRASKVLSKLKVDGVQIEVDAGYEGKKIYLIEAKMGERDNFHIRQLYYPYRTWMAENISKEIVPLFINYANDTLSITQYEFEDFWDISSIRVVKAANYSFEHNPISLTLKGLIDKVEVVTREPGGIPFPQADDIRKVRDTVDVISWGYNSRDEVAKFWNVDKRQGDYYANAGCFLGFIQKEKGKWILSDKGKEFSSMPTTKRNKMLFESMLLHPVFFEVAKYYLAKSIQPDVDMVCKVLQKYTDFEYSKSTLKRRSKTVFSWFEYILKTLDEMNQVNI